MKGESLGLSTSFRGFLRDRDQTFDRHTTPKGKIVMIATVEETEESEKADGLRPTLQEEDYCFETLALHAGTTADPVTGAMLTPIYQTTTYRQEAVGKDKGFKYSRSGNPTVSALERRLAALEGAEFASCYSTGLAATSALFLALLKSGDRVVSSQAVYGGTVRLLRQTLEPFGVETEFVNTSNANAFAKALRKPTRLIFIKTPANPTLKLTDIRLASGLAKQAGANAIARAGASKMS